MEHHFAAAGLKPGSMMWESYLSDSAAGPDPRTWQTRSAGRGIDT